MIDSCFVLLGAALRRLHTLSVTQDSKMLAGERKVLTKLARFWPDHEAQAGPGRVRPICSNLQAVTR
jgi:hypothetical protein